MNELWQWGSWVAGYMLLGLIILGLEKRFGIPFSFLIAIPKSKDNSDKFKERWANNSSLVFFSKDFRIETISFIILWVAVAVITFILSIISLANFILGIVGWLARAAVRFLLGFLRFFHNGFHLNPPA